jgi:hypothetical protein
MWSLHEYLIQKSVIKLEIKTRLLFLDPRVKVSLCLCLVWFVCLAGPTIVPKARVGVLYHRRSAFALLLLFVFNFRWRQTLPLQYREPSAFCTLASASGLARIIGAVQPHWLLKSILRQTSSFGISKFLLFLSTWSA